LTNSFSKKLDNHAAAVALYVAHYNISRVHMALKMTPAMSLGVADHPWTIAELIDSALATEEGAEPDAPAPMPPPVPGRPRFTVVRGGRAQRLVDKTYRFYPSRLMQR
jgi:hypothetical protein